MRNAPAMIAAIDAQRSRVRVRIWLFPLAGALLAELAPLGAMRALHAALFFDPVATREQEGDALRLAVQHGGFAFLSCRLAVEGTRDLERCPRDLALLARRLELGPGRGAIARRLELRGCFLACDAHGGGNQDLAAAGLFRRRHAARTVLTSGIAGCVMSVAMQITRITQRRPGTMGT